MTAPVAHHCSTSTFQRLVVACAFIALALGSALLILNLYGLTQPIRMPGLGTTNQEQLRFIPDEVWTYDQSLEAIAALDQIEDPESLALAANQVVNQSLVHVEWPDVDPIAYRQLVPIWENYFLWGIGMFSGLPQFERYHYANHFRSLERGIGICGDAAIILSGILSDHEINHQILSFPGHVIVKIIWQNGTSRLLDPDFGVDLEMSHETFMENPQTVVPKYLENGYSQREANTLLAAYTADTYAVFDGAYGFMAKRYIFEHASYVIKWLLPLTLLLPGLWLLYVRRNRPKPVTM